MYLVTGTYFVVSVCLQTIQKCVPLLLLLQAKVGTRTKMKKKDCLQVSDAVSVFGDYKTECGAACAVMPTIIQGAETDKRRRVRATRQQRQ